MIKIIMNKVLQTPFSLAEVPSLNKHILHWKSKPGLYDEQKSML